MGPAHVEHGSGPGQEDEMQLPQPDAGGQEVAGRAARRSQETPQRGDGQMVDQAGLSENADARSEEAQQRRHENGEGGEVASGAGGVAQPEAKMHLPQVEDLGAFAARGAEEITGTRSGEADDEGGAGEETVLLRVDDGRAEGGGAGRGTGAARETGTEEARERRHKASEDREGEGETEA